MRRDEGFLLITVLLLVAAVAMLVLGTSFTALVDRAASANQRGAMDAYYIATAGLSKYKTAAFQTYRYYLDRPEKYEDLIRQGNPACGNFLSIGLDLDRDGKLQSGVDLLEGETIGPFDEGAGEYTVRFDVAGRYAVLTAVGRVGRNSRSTVQLVMEPRNAGILNYALFGGGQSSTFLNGNVSIYGGVHLVGNPADPNQYVIDANGNYQQFNYYSSQELEHVVKDSRITGADLERFLSLNHHEQEDLCARLRVVNGRVRLNGSAQAGGAPPSRPAAAGFKTNLEGVNVDGGTGSMDGGTVDRIHADQVSDYDLTTSPPFPRLDDPDLELTQECKDAGAATWRDCIHGRKDLYVLSKETLEAGLCTSGGAPAKASDFMSGGEFILGTQEIECLSGEVDETGRPTAGFRYSKILPEPAKGAKFALVVYGLTNFRGLDVEFTSSVEVRFESQATLFIEALDPNGNTYGPDNPPDPATRVGGNVTIAGDLLPSGSFPDRDVLGIIADGVVAMTGDNQQGDAVPKEQVTMGLFYAGERAEIVKGGIVFGTVLAPEFTFSSGSAGQTSTLLQVPGLSYGSAPGFNLVSDVAKPTFRIVSYERR